MFVKLSQILCSLESGGRPKGGASLDSKGIPSLGAEHLDSNGGFNFKTIKYIPKDYFNGLKSGVIEKENILIVKDGATTGKVSFVNKEFPFEKAAVNEHIFLLKIDKSKAYPKFAFHYLKCPQGQREILRDFRGATVGGISRGFVEFVKFELPPLSDQLHITNLLGKAENLIAQRKESIRLLDEFLKSTFLEMFGSSRNSKFPTTSLEKISLKITDGTHNSPKFISEGVPFLLISNIVNNEITYETKKFISEEEYLLLNKRTPIELGDILITSVGSYGNPALVKTITKFAFQRHIAYIKPNHKLIDKTYMFGSLKSDFIQIQIEKVVRGVAQKTLNLAELRNLQIPIPPIKLQTQFAQIVEKTEALKAQYQQSLQELENLYGSLSQKAFRGEISALKALSV